ncbi:MAG: LysM peptidoglycan-binding domain-containing protein [Candidatus Omnitrophica bacterium]|nr:LysM peptidoglycan-binding domain-containing protein [Candidatus Omnitrophota bacterium]
MNKVWAVAVCIVVGFQLTGCAKWTVRTSTERKVRVDQGSLGNRGFIFGQPTEPAKQPEFKDRKVYKIEVELPELPMAKVKKTKAARKTQAAPKEDREVCGNQGYLVGSPMQRQPAAVSSPQKPRIPSEAKPQAKPQIPTLSTYQVQKGDTLQKISHRFYGTTKKWTLLYQANQDKLKSPDKVFPGQVLVIPHPGEFQK